MARPIYSVVTTMASDILFTEPKPPDPNAKIKHSSISITLERLLKSRNDRYLLGINSAVYRVQHIVILVYQICRAFLLFRYEQGLPLPLIDKPFLVKIRMLLSNLDGLKKVVHKDQEKAEENAKVRGEIRKSVDADLNELAKQERAAKKLHESRQMLSDLINFYEKEFKGVMTSRDLSTNAQYLSRILAYADTSIVTNINNNIQEHFFDYLSQFVHRSFEDLKALKRSRQTRNEKVVKKRT
jgi:predicted XRE-type DNA-binding protein